MDRRDLWRLTKIKYLEPENLHWPVKHFQISRCNSPLKTSRDPLKIVLFNNYDFIIWFPESDKIKITKIPCKIGYRLSSYEENNLAVLYKNNTIIFYSDDGVIRNEINLSNIKWHEVVIMLFLKSGRYLLIATESKDIFLICSLTGKIIIKQKLDKAISKIKLTSDDTVVYHSGKKLYQLSPWLITPLITFPGKKLKDFWYDNKSSKIIVQCSYYGEFKMHSSVIIEDFDEKAWFVNGLFLIESSTIHGQSYRIIEKKSHMLYEVPKRGRISIIAGDSNIFLVHLNDYYYPEYGYIHILYFYIWGERVPFYEKYFRSQIEILEVKFPYIIYMMPDKKGAKDFYAMRI